MIQIEKTNGQVIPQTCVALGALAPLLETRFCVPRQNLCAGTGLSDIQGAPVASRGTPVDDGTGEISNTTLGPILNICFDQGMTFLDTHCKIPLDSHIYASNAIV